MEEQLSYGGVLAFQAQLDEEADGLAAKINESYRELRNKNKEKWERFAKIARLPIIGEFYFKVFKAPKGLIKEPNHISYTMERQVENLYKKAETLEKMKSFDMENWGDEKVDAYFGWDIRGDFSPRLQIPRREAYNEYAFFEGPPVESKYAKEGEPVERMIVYVPKKYDFVKSLDWNQRHGALSEGVFVMDSKTKEVVPISKCRSEENSRSFGWLSDKFGRTPMLYKM
jgi:hypothetical protein